MTKSDKHDFEELAAPAQAAKKLGISVATLRKYSLIVEKVTGNKQYYQRTKQKARLYHQKDLADLKAFRQLAKNSSLTLQEAARQIYTVTDKKTSAHRKAKKKAKQEQLMAPRQVVNLLSALQQTIAHQNQAIDNFQHQLNRIEKQNRDLLARQKTLATPQDKAVEPKIASLPDISGIVTDEDKPSAPLTREAVQAEKRREVQADAKKSQQEMRTEILSKAKENAQKRAHVNVHRTLEDMQLPRKKKHWWQRFLNY